MKRFIIAGCLTVVIGIFLIFTWDITKKEDTPVNQEVTYIFDLEENKEVTLEELDSKINKEEAIVLIGRKSDNLTAKMLTFLKEVKKDYDFEFVYLEKENLNQEDYETWINKYETLKEYAYFEPVLLVFKEKKLEMGYPGDAAYRNIYQFLLYCKVIEEKE